MSYQEGNSFKQRISLLVRYLFCSTNPHRRKLHIACGDFLLSENGRSHFEKRPRPSFYISQHNFSMYGSMNRLQVCCSSASIIKTVNRSIPKRSHSFSRIVPLFLDKWEIRANHGGTCRYHDVYRLSKTLNCFS